MSNTAVIVSGVMRHLVNASSSWLVAADYYLVTEDKIYKPQSITLDQKTVIQTISETIDACSVTFASINILLNTTMMFTEYQLKLHPEFSQHPILGMAFKWKYAFRLLSIVQPVKQYNKILLLRPDLYLHFKKPLKHFDKQLPIPRHFHSTSELHIDPVSEYASIGDTCLMVDWEVFGLLSEFFDYYVQFYTDTTTLKYDVHSLLARYLMERGIVMDSLLFDYLDYTILRDSSVNMFSNGMLHGKYSIEDLRNSQYEWWKENTYNGE